MKHGVSLLRNDMKWKPIHNIHTYIRIHDVHVCIQQMRILKIAKIWKVDGMTSTYAELRIAAISSAMVLSSTTLARHHPHLIQSRRLEQTVRKSP